MVVSAGGAGEEPLGLGHRWLWKCRDSAPPGSPLWGRALHTLGVWGGGGEGDLGGTTRAQTCRDTLRTE